MPYQTKTITNSIGMKFIKIPTGSFLMGRDAHLEEGDEDELPQHHVSIDSFYMQTTPVTQNQWIKIMRDNPSKFKAPNNPVENICWHDAQRFISKLNQIEGENRYRLPTESEWEYAVRAGTTTQYHFGNSEKELARYAWYDRNSENRPHPVGEKKANSWGLYDMYGSIWEWVEESYHENYDHAPNSDITWRRDDKQDICKVLRGGSWVAHANLARSATRNYNRADFGFVTSGFRLVLIS
ncbi:formylglycine-generating enzyme family protein [Sulfurovum sp. bin170]|uniref:formylglycine-generating enzyme family protein n=1 Tax=Sulfurovum sp. bin170 TaxID=2695268 RepID=UPI0013E03525|nr:formylglycine-generating enzyme family protein [Sulfurovum sp. bin170]NEW60868.1 formylglycine-generating enzyme family protein [Sulfurovum sp. bin170]